MPTYRYVGEEGGDILGVKNAKLSSSLCDDIRIINRTRVWKLVERIFILVVNSGVGNRGIVSKAANNDTNPG